MAFNSRSAKELHKQAKASRELYDRVNGEGSSKNIPYSDFLSKQENPSLALVREFEVTYSLDMSGDNYTFGISQKTFNVILPVNSLNESSDIENNTKEAISSIFKGKAKTFIYDNLIVDIEPRGIEKVETSREIDYSELYDSGNLIKDLEQFEVNKTTKGSSTNTNKYDLNIWF